MLTTMTLTALAIVGAHAAGAWALMPSPRPAALIPSPDPVLKIRAEALAGSLAVREGEVTKLGQDLTHARTRRAEAEAERDALKAACADLDADKTMLVRDLARCRKALRRAGIDHEVEQALAEDDDGEDQGAPPAMMAEPGRR